MDWEKQFQASVTLYSNYLKEQRPRLRKIRFLLLLQRWAARLMRRELEWPIIRLLQDAFGESYSVYLRKGEELGNEAYAALLNSDAAGRQWILAAIVGTTAWDERRRCFLRSLFHSSRLPETEGVPEWMFGPMMYAAVYEQDPSFNDHYIEPCLRCFGPHRVNDELFRYLETGTNLEKAETIDAFYHSMDRWAIEAFYRSTGGEADPPEYYSNLNQRLQDWLLTEFVANPDIELRRSIIMYLRLDPENYSQELRPLLPHAIKLAQEHPDKYIRNLIEIALGSKVPTLHMPPTSNPHAIYRPKRWFSWF
ncbi:MAG: hypothetical protein JWL77_2413 [Chthonomonadaceae bacterium]|nr:hypothetical protein [Chthonomonadaceae bacterium]